MSSSLPSDYGPSKAVKDLGIGTYDSERDDNGSHGEDSEETKSETSPRGKTLPDGGSVDVFGPDRLLSYPSTFSSENTAVAELPGDIYRDVTHQHPNTENFDSRVMTVTQSKLPSDEDNPAARSDYYDRMVTGVNGEWPTEDKGVYAQSELPGVMKNEESMDNYLQGIGNWWSGYEVEDVSGSQGFPSTDFKENVDYDRSDLQDGGKIMASKSVDRKQWEQQMDEALKIEDPHNKREAILALYDDLKRVGSSTMRKATNTNVVNDLTGKFLKDFGKKDLTRRHVVAFLHAANEPQYLASDIIRCLKLSHNIYIKDVMDEFPIAKTASNTSIASLRDKFIKLETDNILDKNLSDGFRRCAANLSIVLAQMERLEKNG